MNHYQNYSNLKGELVEDINANLQQPLFLLNFPIHQF